MNKIIEPSIDEQYQGIIKIYQQELDKYKNIVDVKNNYIEELLLIIAKSNDYKMQKDVYEKGLEYDKNLQELKGE